MNNISIVSPCFSAHALRRFFSLDWEMCWTEVSVLMAAWIKPHPHTFDANSALSACYFVLACLHWGNSISAEPQFTALLHARRAQLRFLVQLNSIIYVRCFSLERAFAISFALCFVLILKKMFLKTLLSLYYRHIYVFKSALIHIFKWSVEINWLLGHGNKALIVWYTPVLKV